MFTVRNGRPEDEACVFATWLNSYKHGSPFCRRVPDGIYFAQHHAVIERLLKRSVVRVATIPEDDDVILGWACYEPAIEDGGFTVPAIIHYVYVKPDFRKAGVAQKLLGGVSMVGAMYTHDVFMLHGPLAGKVKRLLFNPYAALAAS